MAGGRPLRARRAAVWLDRSFDGGASWASGSKLGDATVAAGDTGWRTLMYNVDNPSAHGYSKPSANASTTRAAPNRVLTRSPPYEP